MKTLLCFLAFLLIFLDICSAKSVEIKAPKLKAVEIETPKPKAVEIETPKPKAVEIKTPKPKAVEIEAPKPKVDCSKCPKHEKPIDCAELLENGVNKSGMYTIYPKNRLATCQSIEVYCDMETDGGGWTVIQRRGQYGNGEDYFVKKWKDYKEGFGSLKKEFWLGNDKIFSITNQGQYAVRMEMKGGDGKSAFCLYENFWIDNEDANYKLHLSDGSGPAKDAISNHDGHSFYTHDRPNQPQNSRDGTRSGGWWNNKRDSSSLNGLNLYKTDRVKSKEGINWYTYMGPENSFESTEIKVRPKKFN